MKTSVSLLVLSFLFCPVLRGQETAAPGAPSPGRSAASSAGRTSFLNLPEERRKEFAKLIIEASALFQQKRVFECFTRLDAASVIFRESPEVHNLRGSCLVELRSFDKALAEFRRAAELTESDSPSLQFNIAEVLFVTKRWKEAHEAFEQVLRMLPPGDISLGRLVEFKLLLCKMRMDRKQDAAILAEKYDYLDDSPYYYFSRAALAYEEKAGLEAEEWLARANRVFRNPAVLAPWQDTLVEYGYVKSFYGDEEVASE
jgi:predicted Zn-dependent protease